MIRKLLKSTAFFGMGVFAMLSISHATGLEDGLPDVEYFSGDQIHQLATSQSMDICANIPIPAGWVVVSIRAGCGSGVGMYEIAKLVNGQPMTMCALTPVPTGWAVIATQGGCTGGIVRYQIRYADPITGGGFDMCNVPNSVMPPGYVATNALVGCGMPGYQRWYIRTADPALGVMEVCKLGPVPAGWVVTAQRPGCSTYGFITIRYMP